MTITAEKTQGIGRIVVCSFHYLHENVNVVAGGGQSDCCIFLGISY